MIKRNQKLLKVDIFGELELLDELRVMVDPYCNSCEPNLIAKKCRIDISGGLKLLSAKVDCSVFTECSVFVCHPVGC